MANTYSRLFVHIVFAVQGRQHTIPSQHRNRIEQYITATIQNNGHKLLAIYCMPDHTHILIGLNPSIAVSAMVLDIKRASTNFMKTHHLVANDFHWQKGFGAFSYSKSSVPNVINYILQQEQHHRKKTFRQEYFELLKLFDVAFDERYLFEFYD